MNIPTKILVFRQSSLGDVILALPVVNELHKNLPDVSIDFLTKTAYAPIVEFDPGVRNTISFRNNKEFRGLLKGIRAERYELIIDLQRNFRSNLLSLSSPTSRNFRYRKRRLAREMIVRKPSIKLSVDHTINAYFHTLRRLGLNSEPSPPQISIPPAATEFAEHFIHGAFSERPKILIGFCPGARHHEKKWPYKKFREVAEILLGDTSVGILNITASSDDIPTDLELDNPRVIPVADFELLNAAALLEKCDIALSNDSGLMHLANAAGTRVAAIFGPTSPRLGFSPSLPGSVIITRNVFCSPCSLHGERPCRQPRKYCFEDISPRHVADVLQNMTNK